jgi:hypothetical protein
MNRQPYVVAIMLFATINGIFSPFVIAVVPFVVILSPAFFTDSIAVILFVSSLLLATFTLMLGGVPAALYERWARLKESSELSMWIWLAGVALLSLPAVFNFFQYGL